MPCKGKSDILQKYTFYPSIMANEDTTTPQSTPTSEIQNTEPTSFVSSIANERPDNNTYSDFFQETSDGQISVGPRAQKSYLEIFTSIIGYVIPVAIIVALLGSAHVYIRTQESNSFVQEKFSFLCGYLNFGTETISDTEKYCKTFTMIQKEYDEKYTALQESIIVKLNEYIPIKITKNLLASSPEKKFIIDTYKNKVYVDEIIKKFQSVKDSAQDPRRSNIECNGISISNGQNLTTQCTVYGGRIGDDDSNGKLGSARIEALSFLEILGNTASSQFILLNPPGSLNQETLVEGESDVFSTRTNLSIEVQYVPLSAKS